MFAGQIVIEATDSPLMVAEKYILLNTMLSPKPRLKSL